VVRARRLDDREFEALARVLAAFGRKLRDDSQPHRIAQRVKHCAQVDLGPFWMRKRL
jgi:hypothetical protein